jgi:hypothetical protein
MDGSSTKKFLSKVRDRAADLTGVDFSITAVRIEKFNCSTNFDASNIRVEGLEQPVSYEEALRKTVKLDLHHDYGEPLPADA